MATFLLDSTGDFDITTGTLVVTTDVVTEFKQKVAARLNAFKGEWFLDRNSGVPYWERIFIKNPNLSDVQSIIRRAVLSVPGATSIEFLTFEFNASTRKLRVDFRVLTDLTTTPLDFNDALRGL